LERLTVAAPKYEEPAPAAAPEPKIDQTKLASLAKQTEPTPPAPPPTPAAAPADLSQANEKLSSLLGKPDGK
jgi:hypothetical protein